MDSRKKRPTAALIGVTAAALALVAWTASRGERRDRGGTESVAPRGAERLDAGSMAIEKAFRARATGSAVEFAGVVKQLLPDERESIREGEAVSGRRQRFVLELASGRTVMVEHDIEVVRRVPLALGDRVEVSGLYSWSNRGGVVDRTERSPEGSEPGGFIRHEGQVYE